MSVASNATAVLREYSLRAVIAPPAAAKSLPTRDVWRFKDGSSWAPGVGSRETRTRCTWHARRCIRVGNLVGVSMRLRFRPRDGSRAGCRQERAGRSVCLGPAPVELEALTVPPNDGPGFDEGKCRLPAVPKLEQSAKAQRFQAVPNLRGLRRSSPGSFPTPRTQGSISNIRVAISNHNTYVGVK